MSHDVTESRETGARRRSPLTWAVAAAAAAVIIGVGAVSLLGGDESGPPTAGPESTPPAGASEGTVTELTVPDRAGGRCMVPNAQALSGAAFALDGEVTSVEDGVVTLDVTEWYAGDPTDLVRVRQASDDEAALLAAVQFEEGGRYLVAGSADGDLMVCGFSGRFTRDLARLYGSAFGS